MHRRAPCDVDDDELPRRILSSHPILLPRGPTTHHLAGRSQAVVKDLE
jgi:hypothetical protein